MTKKIILAIALLSLTFVTVVWADGNTSETAPWWSKEARGEWWSTETRWAVDEFNKSAPAQFLLPTTHDNLNIVELAANDGWTVVKEVSKPRVGALVVWRNEATGCIQTAVIRELSANEAVYYYYDNYRHSPFTWRQQYSRHYRDNKNFVFIGYIYPERKH